MDFFFFLYNTLAWRFASCFGSFFFGGDRRPLLLVAIGDASCTRAVMGYGFGCEGTILSPCWWLVVEPTKTPKSIKSRLSQNASNWIIKTQQIDGFTCGNGKLGYGNLEKNKTTAKLSPSCLPHTPSPLRFCCFQMRTFSRLTPGLADYVNCLGGDL